MKRNKILGIFWLLVCGYFSVAIIWQLSNTLTVPNLKLTAPLLFVFFACAIYLVGVGGSIFLLRGARWAQTLVGVVALFSVLVLTYQIYVSRSFSVWDALVAVFAIASVVLLLFRRGPVAA